MSHFFGINFFIPMLINNFYLQNTSKWTQNSWNHIQQCTNNQKLFWSETMNFETILRHDIRSTVFIWENLQQKIGFKFVRWYSRYLSESNMIAFFAFCRNWWWELSSWNTGIFCDFVPSDTNKLWLSWKVIN